MRLQQTITIEQAMRVVKRGGQNYFPKGVLTVVHDASTEERFIDPFSIRLVCDGESWRANGVLLLNKRTIQLRSGLIEHTEPMGMYEALSVAIKALQQAGQHAHAVINCMEDEAVMRSLGMILD